MARALPLLLCTLLVSAPTVSSASVPPNSDMHVLCDHFLTVSGYVVGHCPTLDAVDDKCAESFQLFYESPSLVIQCEKHARGTDAKHKMDQFMELYTQWQQNKTCALFHKKEAHAAVHCGGAAVQKPWHQQSYPLYCEETFRLYHENRRQLDALCSRTANSPAFWEAYADFIASPLCKTYYAHVREASSLRCAKPTVGGEEENGCERMFDWYQSNRDAVEQECLEVQGASAFYKGFYAWKRVHAEFVYYDFNGTTGLVLNGDAATSSCIRIQRNEYSDRTGANDVREATIDPVFHQRLESVVAETTITEDPLTSPRIAVESASIGHRDVFVKSQQDQRCAVRLRLTASQPRQLASVWYADALPVLQGFETRFTFQISDQLRRCYEVTDENFGVRHYRSCVVHGGDGFAFVIHSNANETTTLAFRDGTDRSEMGAEGVANSLAIEFDTWFNGDKPDTFEDHVAIYSRGVGASALIDSARLSTTALHDLADGRIHAVKIRYYNELRYEYVSYFSATSNLAAFLKDVSEGRRIGTLLVFMDDGIETDTPLLAIPINLAATLRLEADHAFVGFTASTGKSWQKHDVLGWYYCTQPPCLDEFGEAMTFEFDYNQQSMVSTASHGNTLYPIYIYPDTTSWVKRQTYFAANQQVGLVSP